MAEEKLNIYQKLIRLQQETKVTKSQHNSFGNYNFRSAEQILEEVKPITDSYGLCLTLSDELEVIDGWHYVTAIAKLVDAESGDNLAVKGHARESEIKKGMDSSQITGTASSYARKYALSGLLLLDDNKDADTNEYAKKTKATDVITSKEVKVLESLITKKNVDVTKVCSTYGIDSLSKMSPEMFTDCLKRLEQ